MKQLQSRWLSQVLIGGGLALLLLFFLYEGGACTPYSHKEQSPSFGEHAAAPAPSAPPPAFAEGKEPESVLPSGEPAPLPGEEGDSGSLASLEAALLGVIQIPRLALSQNIVEGHGAELMIGVGHSPGTALPGQEGNCVLSGHRNYAAMRPFRHLHRLEEGDRVNIQVGEEEYSYRVIEMFEVEPSALWVMDAPEEPDYLLTLITCTPLYTYNRRLIVRCRLEPDQSHTLCAFEYHLRKSMIRKKSLLGQSFFIPNKP